MTYITLFFWSDEIWHIVSTYQNVRLQRLLFEKSPRQKECTSRNHFFVNQAKEWIPRRYLLILPREINLMMSEIMFSNSWWAEIDVTTYFVWSVEEEFCGEGKNWTWALLMLHAETLNKHFFSLSFSLLRNLHYAFEVVLCYIITWLITKRNFSLQRNKISRQIQSSRQHKTVHKTYPK